jgi:hypothetical protein
MPCDQKRRADIIGIEFMGQFMKAINPIPIEGSIAHRPTTETYTYQGTTVTFHKYGDDALADDKAKAAKLAIKTVLDTQNNAFALPQGIRFFCTSNEKAKNQVFGRDPGWNAIYYVVLGPTCTLNNRLMSISNEHQEGCGPNSKGHVTCLHELGHVLHIQNMGEDFYALSSQGGIFGEPTGTNARQVSAYAFNNKKEFVAEVFAGMMIGRKYSDSVMDEYRSYKGPI